MIKNNIFLKKYFDNINNKIEKLKIHFLKNKKDLHSKRGFILLISKKKKILKYIKKNKKV
ncbi:30S ribosomal protein S15 [Candidatus Nardonella dryophthoridicola]|uniref:30S ribosomal protein S15 n=1 Tax=endosymbiont of Rhynchophorus ferrugineus TaxID=1972133 RepID=A0A2Z5TI88_9GAMM|nr:30S ribosomal protein S15 [Candidatus Nardonella dryophthoridicola]QTJ62940.1 30S ribosomal protein S15 [Candidatus Nardonella dryophthoridicola]BBA84992.1 30S ribosomal protein S15 [endosymbiont of Rhynchophorus ferrugineus]